MKALKIIGFITLLFLAIGSMGCSLSLDTVKYMEPTDNIIQSVSCDKVVNIKINESIMFEFDSSEIMETEMAKIQKVANIMIEDTNIDVLINAYASTEGDDDYNLNLTKTRANIVKSALVDLGVDSEHIIAIGQGETGKFGDVLKNNRRALILDITNIN